MNEVDLGKADTAIAEGLKIARDCGFGLYHIDLLLERARLHLLRGDANAALEAIELALDAGISANDETGQPELLAAKHEECGYAWAIPAGLQLRAEALLLQAAQEVVSVGWALPIDGVLKPINVPAVGKAHPTIGQLIDHAKQCLNEAMDRWQPLHDPEPERPDQNFKLDAKEYNYRAAETHQVLVLLEDGVFTRYPLKRIETASTGASEKENAVTSPTVFISYSHKDEVWKDRVCTQLGVLVQQNLVETWDDRRIDVGDDWEPEIEQALQRANAAVLMISANFLTSKFILGKEIPRLLERRDKEGLRVIPVIVKPCAWQTVPWLAKLQCRPTDGRPLSAGDDNRIEQDLADLALEINRLLNP